MADQPKRFPVLLLLTVVAVVAVGGYLGGTWYLGQQKLEAEQRLVALIPLKNRAVAELENEHQGDVAVPAEAFAKIAAAVPGDPLGARDLVIFRVLDLKRDPSNKDLKPSDGHAAEGGEAKLTESEKQEIFERKLADARQAIAALRKVEPEAISTDVLEARIDFAEAVKSTDIDQKTQLLYDGLERLKRAAETAATDAALWYEVYSTIETNHMDQAELAEKAAERAYAAAPDNIAAVLAHLIRSAKRRDPKCAELLTEAKPVLEPLADAINLTDASDTDAAELLANCRDLAEKKDFKQLEKALTVLDNVVKTRDVVRSDRQRLNRHELDFTLFQFRDEPAIVARVVGAAKTTDDSAAKPHAITFAKPTRPVARGDKKLIAAQLHDINLDGRLDIVAAHNQGIEVWLQSADATFELASEIETPTGVRGFLAIDLERYDENSGKANFGDNPPLAVSQLPEGAKGNTAYVGCVRSNGRCEMGPLDFVVYGDFGVEVFQNELDIPGKALTFSRREQNETLKAVRDVHLAVAVDFDHDSDLDLVLAGKQGIQLWSNLGIFRFRDVSKWSRLPPTDLGITSIVAVDWDRDLDIDFIVAGEDKQSIGILENMRHGIVHWRSFADDASFAALAPSKHLAVAELDGNVSWDLVSAGEGAVHRVLTATHAGPAVRPISETQYETAAAQMIVFDANHDAIQDVIAISSDGQLSTLQGTADGGFLEHRLVGQVANNAALSVDCGDIDGDGDLDLLAVDNQGIVVVKNKLLTSPDKPVDGAGWISLCAVGLADNKGRNNNNGIGSLVEVRGGGRYQAQVVTRQHTHFGIGAQRQADIVRIVWPNGMPQTLVRPGANQMLCEHAILKGSCPYLYAFNGERIEFVTDCLWAAPIGMQVTEGVLAPCRPWEYILVPGESLAPKNGQYEIKITEELWEATYLDHVELIAVDHPADVEVYSNEKVGPPDIAAYKVHTVRQRRYPLSAVDQQGRDVLPKLSKRDNVFLRPWDRQIQQGRVEPHFIELDLGELAREGKSPEQITLFLTGWVFPTDVTINISLSQNPELDGPRFPYVLTPDADGNWREAQAFVGFPGGKTKTIAIDLSKAFATNDYRVRVASTGQLYWDEAFFTVDEAPAEVRTNTMSVAEADLHYRGFSRIVPQPDHAPDYYDYRRVVKSSQWAPMAGQFTDYGAVANFLTAEDDFILCMGAGDEVTIRFDGSQLPELPSGWKRDFLLHAVGWDKDADLHTICGQMVEPLPYVSMATYPPLPTNEGDSLDAFVNRETRQAAGRNRQTSWAEFWRALHPTCKALPGPAGRGSEPVEQVTPPIESHF